MEKAWHKSVALIKQNVSETNFSCNDDSLTLFVNDEYIKMYFLAIITIMIMLMAVENWVKLI